MDFWRDIWTRHILRASPQPLLFRVAIEKVDREAADPGYIRIKANGHAFFTHRHLLADDAPLSLLTPGRTARVGAHRLEDGRFWLHWLHGDPDVEFLPRDEAVVVDKWNRAATRGRASIYGGGALLAVTAILAVFFHGGNDALGFFAGVAGVGLIGCGGLYLHRASAMLRAAGDPAWRTLLDGLERARRRETNGFADLCPPPSPEGDRLPAVIPPQRPFPAPTRFLERSTGWRCLSSREWPPTRTT